MAARDAMSLHDVLKKTWISVQQKHSVPVSIVGVEIDSRDTSLLKLWKQEGIDKYARNEDR